MVQVEQPLILALTEDLFIVPRLQDVAGKLGYRLTVADSPAIFDAEGEPSQRDVPLTEPLEGPEGRFMRRLVELRPALMLVDVTARNLPWARWIQIVKTAAATRRIPVVAFGPHVDQQALDLASSSGADAAITRGKLQNSLPQLIERYARKLDPQAVARACDGSLSALASQGVELLNSGDYFQAHELLEAAFMQAEELEGYLYRSLLQIAVAYLHVQRGNYSGAVKMMLRLQQWLVPLPDHCRGVDVARLKQDIHEFAGSLEHGGRQGLAQLVLRPVPLLGVT